MMGKRSLLVSSISALLLFAGLFSISLVFKNETPLGGKTDYVVTMFASLILLFWGLTMSYRIQFNVPKRIISAIYIIGFFWMLLKFVKWLVHIPVLIKYIDYLYYVPMVLIPSLFFVFCIENFNANFRFKKPLYIGIFVFTLFLVLMALTNDAHGLIYHNYHFGTFPDGSLKIQSIQYTYGPIHYVAMAYIGLVIVLSTLHTVIGAKLSPFQSIVPTLIVIMGIYYFVMYAMNFDFARNTPFLKDLALMSIIFLQASIESMLDVGIVQNNGRYASNFSRLMLPMCIYDEKHNILFKSERFDEQSYLTPNPNLRSDEKKLGLYTVVSQANLEEILNLKQKIDAETTELENAGKLLLGMLEVTTQQASVSYRLALADEIENSIGKSKQELNALVSSLPDEITDENSTETKRTLGRIALCLGYMKQKCMLLLGAKERKSLSADAFSMLLNVISHDVQSVGFKEVAVAVASKDEVDFSIAIAVNELADEVAKAYEFLSLNALFVVNPTARTCSVELDGQPLKIKRLIVPNVNLTTRKADNGLRIFAEVTHD